MNIALDTVQIWRLLTEKLSAWGIDLVKVLPNLVVACVIMALAVGLSQLAVKLIRRMVGQSSDNRTVSRLLSAFARFVIVMLGLFAALGVLNLEKTVASLLAGAGVLGLALGFAFQEIAANFFAGILIALRKPYREGDIVQIDTFLGTVNQITLRTTNLSTFSGLEVLIPNKDMFTKPVTNFTSTPDRRVEINAGVSYGDDLRKVEKIALEVARGVEGCLLDRPVDFYFTGFGDSSITFQLCFWVKYPAQQIFMKATHEAIIQLKEAFDKNGISLPFPVRTLDFGIKGGETLSAMIAQAPAANTEQKDVNSQ